MISLPKSKSDPFSRRAILLSSDKLAVYHWYRGKLGNSYLFGTDETGRRNFARYLQQTPDYPIYVLVDIMEEEFRTDTIPHVFGSDRKALIKRRQSRLFKETVYFHTQIQGREEQGRRDSKVLFMALSNQEIIRPWLEILEQHKVPLAGMSSLPLVTESFLKYLPEPSDHMLVVSMQSLSGLRQTFFHDRQLKLSRLMKLPRYGTAPYAPRIFSEVDKIRRYLNSLMLVSIQQPLDIYFLAHRGLLIELQQQPDSVGPLKRHLIDIDQLAHRMGIGIPRSTPFSDRLFIAHLLSESPPNAYALPAEMRYNKIRKLRHAVNFAGLSLFLLTAMYGSFNLVRGLALERHSAVASSQAKFYTDRYNLARERLQPTPVEPAQLKVAADLLTTLNQYKSTPVNMMRWLGASLTKFPDVQLQHIDWLASIDPDPQTDAATDADDARDRARYYQIMTINARLQPFDGDYRTAIATAHEFAEELRQNEAVHKITMLTLPLDLSSEASLSGDVKAVGGKAAFSLRAVIGIYDDAPG